VRGAAAAPEAEASGWLRGELATGLPTPGAGRTPSTSRWLCDDLIYNHGRIKKPRAPGPGRVKAPPPTPAKNK